MSQVKFPDTVIHVRNLDLLVEYLQNELPTTPGSPIEGVFKSLPWSYMCYPEDSKYKFLGRDGTVESYDEFVDGAMDLLTANGMSLALTPGNTYTMEEQWDIDYRILVDGFSMEDTILQAASGFASEPVVDISQGGTKFRNLELDCDYKGTHGVRLDNAGSVEFDHVWINDPNGDGFRAEASSECNSIKFINGRIYDAKGYGINFGQNIGHYRIKANTIRDASYGTDTDAGIFIDYGGQGIIAENFLWGHVIGMLIESSENHTIGPNNQITGCGTGIKLMGSCYDVGIDNNFFWENNWKGGTEYHATDDQYSDIWATDSMSGGISLTGNRGDGASHTIHHIYGESYYLNTGYIDSWKLRNYKDTLIVKGSSSNMLHGEGYPDWTTATT